MFHLRRRRQESYLYLSDSLDDENDVGGFLSSVRKSWRRQHDSSPMKSQTPEDEEPVVVPKMSVEQAMKLQKHYTSWPSSIWEINFDDADGEIVFDECLSDDDVPSESSWKKKSVGSEDTEDTLPSSCSSPPSFQNTWELHELELSAIMDEDCSDEEDGILAVPQGCDLLGCIAAIHNEANEALPMPLCTETSADSSGASNYFLIEESFADSSEDHQLAALRPAKPKIRKRLRFADEEGGPMETVHFLTEEEENATQRRILILMLLPKQKKYEFVHAEYSTESQLTASALLKQLPDLASDPLIKKQRYTRLCRAAGGSELINAIPIQSYYLHTDEILVAVLEGYTGQAMHKMAKALVENDKILRAVKRTNKAAHTLHQLECEQGTAVDDCSFDFEQPNEKLAKECRQDSRSGQHSEVLIMTQSLSTELHQYEREPTLELFPSADNLQHDLGVANLGSPPTRLSSTEVESAPHLTTGAKKQNAGIHVRKDDSVTKPSPEGRKERGFVGLFGGKRKESPKVRQAFSQSEDRASAGKKVFPRFPSPRRAVQPCPGRNDAGSLLGRNFSPQRPSQSKVERASAGKGDHVALFGKRVFQRKPSQSPVAHQDNDTKDLSPNQQIRIKTGWSNLAKPRWGKLKNAFSRRHDIVDVQQ